MMGSLFFMPTRPAALILRIPQEYTDEPASWAGFDQENAHKQIETDIGEQKSELFVSDDGIGENNINRYQQ